MSYLRPASTVPAFRMMVVPLAAFALLWFILLRPGSAKRLMRGIKPELSAKLLSVLLVIAALVVLARGNVWAALCLFGGALWLLGRTVRRSPPRVSGVSRARSAYLEMEYEHATGGFAGRVVAGQWVGAALAALDRPQCEALFEECRRHDPDGARLLQPYLDRRFPGWRAASDHHANAGERRARFTSRMSEDEAYQMLGLSRGATRDEIVRAHRTIMKKWHPDQGGTADLAARANEAKEVLLRRHD